MARAWVHDRMNDADYRDKIAKAKSAKRKPPWRWQVRWYDPDGKRQTELREKKKEAEDYADLIATQLANGVYRDPKAAREKVRVVAEEWFTAKLPKWSPKTQRLYREVLDGYIYPKWGSTAVGAVAYGPFTTWLSGLYGKPGLTGSSKRKVGESRLHMIHHVMRSILGWAVKSDRLPSNPLTKLDTLPAIPKSKRTYYDHKQIDYLAKAMAALTTAYGKLRPCRFMYMVMVLVIAYCGLRMGETVALRKAACDLDHHDAKGRWTPRLHIVEAAREDADGNFVIGLPKGGKLRFVGVAKFLVPLIRILLEGLEDDDFVFTSTRGGMINPHNWRHREFKAAVAAAGLDPDTSPHWLRHAYAALAAAGGADVKTLQESMGHASATMTLDVYGDLYPPRVDEVADAIDHAREVALAA